MMKHIQTNTSMYINLHAQLWQGIYNDDQHNYIITIPIMAQNTITPTHYKHKHVNTTLTAHKLTTHMSCDILHTLYNMKIL